MNTFIRGLLVGRDRIDIGFSVLLNQSPRRHFHSRHLSESPSDFPPVVESCV